MDAVRTAVMNNRFTAIVEEASAVMYRTAHTTFVKLVQDYQCAVATPEGEIFAYPSQSGVSSFIGVPLQKTIEQLHELGIDEGDCFLTNDPFSTDGLVTHMMDVTMVRPIFVEGQLIAFSWGFVHASDIGGAVPGSISPAFTEVFQEGIRIRPVKLYKKGEINEDVRRLLLDNSRIPDDLWGDMKAMLSALQSMDRRFHQLCEAYGRSVVEQGMRDVLSFAEMKARAVIAKIPDGIYEFGDYLEGIEPGQHTYIRCAMRVHGNGVTFDFNGTDPQIPAAYNFVSGDRTHPYTVQAFLYYLLTVEPDAPRNAGLLRAITMHAPRGTVINAEFPAAGGSRVAASTRVYDTLLGCLQQAVKGGLTASGPGMSAVIVLSARDPRSGKRRVSVINPLCGGGGGRAGSDGTDAIDSRSGYLKSVPTEVIEVETVLFVHATRLLEDSYSPGRWRSGAALLMEMENTDAEATMTIRGMNRFSFRPWGVHGGHPGRMAEVVLNPGKDDEEVLQRVTVLKLKRGDVLRLITPSGGGFGDPLDRDPDAIRNDMQRGMLSAEAAFKDYGVVFESDGSINYGATDVARAERRSTNAPAAFDMGPERKVYDAIWPDAVRARFATAALQGPKAHRQLLVDAVRKRLTAAGETVTDEALQRAITEETARLSGDSVLH
ncbi:methylhydantoinase [Trinickia symbiotica]|uniref:Methylhydantoinase n=1 Tax=Trinickia symbiotica TaxID=863227 RepID=A0A2T3XJU2_9BURK|nr:hydantoinase B/oxoprolinase family protein [Trinickia symbiotica]PTB16800.1 methylhydantoinase [Trinickia symbiotica]